MQLWTGAKIGVCIHSEESGSLLFLLNEYNPLNKPKSYI